MQAQTFVVTNSTTIPNTHGNPITNFITFDPQLIPISNITIDIVPTIGASGTIVLPHIRSNIPTSPGHHTKVFSSFPITIPGPIDYVIELTYDVVIPIPPLGDIDLDQATFTYTIDYSYTPCESVTKLPFFQSESFLVLVSQPLIARFLPHDVAFGISTTCQSTICQRYVIYSQNIGAYELVAELSFYPNGLNQTSYPPGFTPILSHGWIDDSSNGRVYRNFTLPSNMPLPITYPLNTIVGLTEFLNYTPTIILFGTYPSNQISRVVDDSGTLVVVQGITGVTPSFDVKAIISKEQQKFGFNKDLRITHKEQPKCSQPKCSNSNKIIIQRKNSQ